jgi:lysyl-tRNA synthetase class 2
MSHSNDNTPSTIRNRLAALEPRLRQRARIFSAIRTEFEENGFWEVQTPVRIPYPAPEFHIDPEPSRDHFLTTSPELQMKRLLAAGYANLFQISPCFRLGERGKNHLPEFTMLEWYRTDASIVELMEDCQSIIKAAATAIQTFPIIERQGKYINLTPPWKKLDVSEAFEKFAGWKPGPSPNQEMFDRDLVSKVEPSLPLNEPVFLTGYPASMASLARLNPNDPSKAERFELYAGGLELANGFTELTDPNEQRMRFEAERKARADAKKNVWPIDEKFLNALELGLKPCAGIAMGLDRLVMLLTGAPTIDDVVTFTDETV